MNCFVIMPFDEMYDDVYNTIKESADSSGMVHKCWRLDEERPAGIITERLLSALRDCTACIADISNCKPNVMWEVGFAMALDKPIIIITQSDTGIPFDIQGMQHIRYNREHLSHSLKTPLTKMIKDTLLHLTATELRLKESQDKIQSLTNEVKDLKQIIAQAITHFKLNAKPEEESSVKELSRFEGCWLSVESNSFVYGTIIDNELVMPYCYRGNTELTGVYFGFRIIGDFWFSRYQWIGSDISGFAFAKFKSDDIYTGSWWSNASYSEMVQAPPDKAGVLMTWVKKTNLSIPTWAEEFITSARKRGLRRYLKDIGLPRK
jgi:nucleoside 2-deoxyribosyltransferase